jgi:transposase
LLLVDSTIVKAHPHAAGARKRGEADATRRSVDRGGGFTTKIHAVVSDGGRLVRYRLTGGQVNDVTQANSQVRGLHGRAVVGDRAYDADEFLAAVAAQGMTAVIPSRVNRKVARRLDAVAYAQRNVIERFFGRMKGFRRIATRYDKTAASYAASWALAGLCHVDPAPEGRGRTDLRPRSARMDLALSGLTAAPWSCCRDGRRDSLHDLHLHVRPDGDRVGGVPTSCRGARFAFNQALRLVKDALDAKAATRASSSPGPASTRSTCGISGNVLPTPGSTTAGGPVCRGEGKSTHKSSKRRWWTSGVP